MKKLLLGTTLLLISLFAQAKITGYGQTEWGMTPAQVLKVETGKAKVIKPEKYQSAWGKIKSENVKIGNGTYTTIYAFNDSNQLSQIRISSNGNKSRAITTAQFNDLKNIFTKKYGDPTFGIGNHVYWNKTDFSILLSKSFIKDIYANTSIVFIPADRNLY